MTLTDEEIRIKVAESLGYKDLETKWEKYHQWECPDGRVRFGTIADKYACLPNYPESLDACAEFEATLTEEEWETYADYLLWSEDEPGHSNYTACKIGCSATPRQRCLAYLKTKGLIP